MSDNKIDFDFSEWKETSNSNVSTSGVSLFSFGVLFLATGLVMKDVCDGIEEEVCVRVYDNGHNLMITGVVFLSLPLIFALIFCVTICCCVSGQAFNKINS